MDEEKALSDLLCDLSARMARRSGDRFPLSDVAEGGGSPPGSKFQSLREGPAGQGAQSPAYGRQLPPAPQAQVAEVPNGVWPACSRGGGP